MKNSDAIANFYEMCAFVCALSIAGAIGHLTNDIIWALISFGPLVIISVIITIFIMNKVE